MYGKSVKYMSNPLWLSCVSKVQNVCQAHFGCHVWWKCKIHVEPTLAVTGGTSAKYMSNSPWLPCVAKAQNTYGADLFLLLIGKQGTWLHPEEIAKKRNENFFSMNSTNTRPEGSLPIEMLAHFQANLYLCFRCRLIMWLFWTLYCSKCQTLHTGSTLSIHTSFSYHDKISKSQWHHTVETVSWSKLCYLRVYLHFRMEVRLRLTCL